MILLRWIRSYYLIIFKYLNFLFSWFVSFYGFIKKKSNCTYSIYKSPPDEWILGNVKFGKIRNNRMFDSFSGDSIGNTTNTHFS